MDNLKVFEIVEHFRYLLQVVKRPHSELLHRVYRRLDCEYAKMTESRYVILDFIALGSRAPHGL